MKTVLFAALLLATATTHAAGIQISAREKTLEVEKGEKVDLPHGDVRLRNKTVQVVMTLRNMHPANKGTMTVQWSILSMGAKGRVMEVQQKTREVELPVGQDVVVESDPLNLYDVRWDSDRKSDNASRAQEIHGYGVRVLNGAGEVVGEMYKPGDAQGVIHWRDLNPKKEPVPREAAPEEPRRKWLRPPRVPGAPEEEVPKI